jgi:predicted XRE-type DNA-binding protein
MPVIIDYTDDRLYLKGANEAREKTLVENIEKLLKNGKFSLQDIAEGLEVPIEKVKEIQARIKSGK